MYENLIREHPDVQEFKTALNSISHQAWALQGLSQGMLLFDKQVQEKLFEELQLSDDQIQKIKTLSEELQKQRLERGLEFVKISKDRQRQQGAWFRKQAESNAKELAGILSAEQANRLKQIVWQHGGANSFSDGEVIGKLQLSAEQLEGLRAVQDSARKSWWEAIHRCPNWNQAMEKNKGNWEESRRKAMELLTEDQKARWREMIGKPFPVEFHFPAPPRFGPHSGRRPDDRTREGPGGSRNW
jgi:hypothetical protein